MTSINSGSKVQIILMHSGFSNVAPDHTGSKENTDFRIHSWLSALNPQEPSTGVQVCKPVSPFYELKGLQRECVCGESFLSWAENIPLQWN